MYKITGFDIKSKNDEVLDYVDDNQKLLDQLKNMNYALKMDGQ